MPWGVVVRIKQIWFFLGCKDLARFWRHYFASFLLTPMQNVERKNKLVLSCAKVRSKLAGLSLFNSHFWGWVKLVPFPFLDWFLNRQIMWKILGSLANPKVSFSFAVIFILNNLRLSSGFKKLKLVSRIEKIETIFRIWENWGHL